MIAIDTNSDIPLYRQLYSYFTRQITTGLLRPGERLPPTRELAGQLGLNRTTISAAYELLETEGWIFGEVGRGSFVRTDPSSAPPRQMDWANFLDRPAVLTRVPAPAGSVINFSHSRPAQDLFPLENLRASVEAVLAGPELPQILQLGSPGGYEPLRNYLWECAKVEGVAQPTDDLLITSGCQQALALIRDVLVRPGDSIALEDPVYPGLRTLFQHSGADIQPWPVGTAGIDPEAVARTPLKLAVVTPNFQNPTGATMSLAGREALLRQVGSRSILVENDTYGPLRYEGSPAPSLKQLDRSGSVILLRSFSKIAFPGLRVGWMIGPRPVIQRLTEAKAMVDLHSDHFSQAVMLEFARSGRLAQHLTRTLVEGRERRSAVLSACARSLPPGSRFTRPEGGMNLWVELPGSLDTAELLPKAHHRGVSYLPGKFFSLSRAHPSGLRLSFAGLSSALIESGVEALGCLFSEELAAERSRDREPAPAMV